MNESAHPGPEPRVVVGFDHTAASHAAVDFAFREAAMRAATVHVIHAWDYDSVVTAAYVPDDELDRLRRRVHQQLATALRPHARAFPAVAVTLTLVHGAPDRALLDASIGAELLVVGSRGRGELATLLLGSTSATLLHHAHCPVAIVRDDGRRARSSSAGRLADGSAADLNLIGT